jgi:lysylphosphatidylglycerol synthetase-like protein (DUF2156 family)
VNHRCSNCGSTVEPDDLFCWSCGASINLPENGPPVAPRVAKFSEVSGSGASAQSHELLETRRSERRPQSQAPIAFALSLVFIIVFSGVALFVLAPTVLQDVFQGLSSGLAGGFRGIFQSIFVSPFGVISVVFILIVVFIPFAICLGGVGRRR